MKLWEVLKVLEENPKKRFRNCFNNSNEIQIGFFDNRLFWLNPDGGPKEVFEIRDRRSGTGICDNVGDIWKEVKQPVTWQEAIHAWANGKRVTCESVEGTFTYDSKVHGNEIIAVEDEYAVSPDEIRNGKWFIEEDK